MAGAIKWSSRIAPYSRQWSYSKSSRMVESFLTPAVWAFCPAVHTGNYPISAFQPRLRAGVGTLALLLLAAQAFAAAFSCTFLLPHTTARNTLAR